MLMFVYLYIRSIIELIENVKKTKGEKETNVTYRRGML